VAEDGTARLSAEQARAILDLRLQRLTALGREEIKEELDKLAFLTSSISVLTIDWMRARERRMSR
jgi:DNA gyrase/topoisomerase IV subunit A